MKKITLIACAALVAGLLVSCSNDAGAKDYNSVRYTTNVNNYLVSGTKTTVVTSESAGYARIVSARALAVLAVSPDRFPAGVDDRPCAVQRHEHPADLSVPGHYLRSPVP